MANTKVQSEQIEDGSITADKIADGAIVATELADNAVTTAKINADAVTGAKIADDAINSEHYTDGSIDTAHIADDQVTQAKMANDSVGADELASDAVVTASIVDANVTTAKIADGNISTAKIADNAVTSAKIDTNIDIAGTFDVTSATTLDSTLTVASHLGIGTTSPTTFSGYVSVHHKNTAGDAIHLIESDGGIIGQTFVNDASGVVTTGARSNHPWRVTTNDTERLRVDTLGRLLVGHDAAHSDGVSQSYYAKLIVKGNTYSSNTDGRIVMQNGVASTSMANDTALGELIYTNGSGGDHAAIKAFGDGAGADNDYPGRLSFWTTADGADNPTERARISSAGLVCIGDTEGRGGAYDAPKRLQLTGPESVMGIKCTTATDPSQRTAILFNDNGGTARGFISLSNASTVYNTGSDYRLKEVIEPLSNGLDRLNQLKPVKFKWTDTGHIQEGFIAHEVQEICPEAVSGEKDAVHEDGTLALQGMDYGRITPLLVKAIQEQQTIIDDLKARIEALES